MSHWRRGWKVSAKGRQIIKYKSGSCTQEKTGTLTSLMSSQLVPFPRKPVGHGPHSQDPSGELLHSTPPKHGLERQPSARDLDDTHGWKTKVIDLNIAGDVGMKRLVFVFTSTWWLRLNSLFCSLRKDPLKMTGTSLLFGQSFWLNTQMPLEVNPRFS